MNIDEAKELVIKAGIKLIECGLIARTWGNVSCRVDDKSFVITPSGRDYLSLKPEEIVQVNIKDLSYKGDVKPSSEKGIHAETYTIYSDVNFIIHTHQDNASVVGTSGLDYIDIKESNPLLGDKVICAKYALPGTKALRKNVGTALKESKGKAVIMKYHGALCFGKNYDETFLAATELEKVCYDFVVNKYLSLSNRKSFIPYEMAVFALTYLNKFDYKFTDGELSVYSNSRRTEKGFIIYSYEKEIEVENDKVDLSFQKEAETYKYIYAENKNINNIIFNNSPEILAISYFGITIKPILDDYAQIIGSSVKNVDNNPILISKALKKSPLVFVRNLGALCCGKTNDDALAVSMIAQKACKAYIGASLFGKVKPINSLECMLMRFIYLKKYSKKAEINN